MSYVAAVFIALVVGYIVGAITEARHTRNAMQKACPVCKRVTLHAYSCKYARYPE